jgi:hypothetical protein
MNEPRSHSDPSRHEDATRRRRRGHHLFSFDYGELPAYPDFHARQSPVGTGGFIQHSKAISLALNLLPFSGIAFLWFIGVLRDRLGELEDRFFATVFLGSGLLFVAMMFTSAAVAGGIITILGPESASLIQSGSYALGRAETYQAFNIYAVKMAGVFMMATCTLSMDYLGNSREFWLGGGSEDWGCFCLVVSFVFFFCSFWRLLAANGRRA